MINEGFLDHGSGDLVADIDGDLVVADRKRHVASVDLGHQRAERLVAGSTLESLKPQRRFFELGELVVLEAENLCSLDGDFLIAGGEQFDRRVGRGDDLHHARGQPHLLRRDQFDQRAGPQRDVGLLD